MSDDEIIVGAETCEALYSKWLVAKARFYNPAESPDDATFNERQKEYDEATRAFVGRPAASPWMVWRKWEVLDALAAEEADTGPFTDVRLIATLGCIKADILRFGLKERD